VLPAEFYVPDLSRMQAQSTNNKQGSGDVLDESTGLLMQQQILALSLASYKTYEAMLSRGLARELARMVLPLNIYTRWWMTCDLRNLLNFLRLRLDAHAQWEAQQYALAIVDLIRPLVPCTVKIFEESLTKGGA
jgi:thymidylate synthase (FAD)